MGALSAETLDAKVDINGTTFKDASARVGSGGSSHEVRAMSSSALPFFRGALCLRRSARVVGVWPVLMEHECN